MIDPHHGWNVSAKPLWIGVILSLGLTCIAYLLVATMWVTGGVLAGTLMGLAALQVGVQLCAFFHLGVEEKPRWNLMLFLFMVLVLFVLVGGSLWIMYHLDYNLMPTM